MAWDAPTCSALEDEFDGYHDNSVDTRRTVQRASPCASGTFPLSYQLRYGVVESTNGGTNGGVFGE